MANIRCCGVVTKNGYCALYFCPCPAFAGVRQAHRTGIAFLIAAVVIVICGGLAGLYWGN